MRFRRGFKTEARELAREVRTELVLTPFDRLNPRQLAERLEIPVLALSDLAPSCDGASYLLEIENSVLSALTVFEGHRRIVIHNDSHSAPRQNSNLTHELAHGLLHHEPAPAFDTNTGCRLCNTANEDEANWLAGELLVTRQMALTVARGRITEQNAIRRLQVSAQMLKWRMNVTGATKQAARERATRRAG